MMEMWLVIIALAVATIMNSIGLIKLAKAISLLAKASKTNSEAIGNLSSASMSHSKVLERFIK